MPNDERAAAVTKAAQELATALVEASTIQSSTPRASKPGQNVISLEQGFKDRDYFSGKLSEISRQLGLAGIAIIWVFKSVQGTQQIIPPSLVFPGLVIVLSLIFDFLQYFVANALLEYFTTRAHKKGLDEFTAPSWMNIPSRCFFYGKLALIAFAYFYLILFLILKLVLGVL